ncbi:hypothetical protein IT412_04540 [Candidatus Peregrinibacteria bacterium]|nr:hypothetical protein [Candidatus Peregrinibacteria bacterium]
MEKDQKQFRAIISELQNMVEVDQAMRNNYRYNPEAWDETVDYQNTKRMKTIIDEIGWPSISKVGETGSSNAWLLVQHADHDPEFQKKCLDLMKSEREGEVSKRNIAYLEDRIAVADGKPQIYGTQFHKNSSGQLEPLPIQNADNVDKRRKEMGLEPLTENQRRIQERYGKKRA